MNKGYKGLYLKEMKKNEELEVSLKKSKDNTFRLTVLLGVIAVLVTVEAVVVFFGGKL